MDKIKYISKQWTITLRDFFKSFYYGAIVPALVAIQNIIETGHVDLSWQLVGKIAVGALVAHIIRKVTEPTKQIEITTLTASNGSGGNIDDGDGNPPPVGDPIKPKV